MMFTIKNLRAFSIPEVVLSVFVLSVGLITVVHVMMGSLNFSLKDRDTIVATGLAQEGVELVRNVRDNDVATGGTGFGSFSSTKRHCKIDGNDSIDTLSCTTNQQAAENYTLQYADGFYSNGGGAGEFSRYVYVNYNSGSGGRARIRSFVFWGNFEVSDVANGRDSNCVIVRDGSSVVSGCVSAEAFLTAWR